MTTFKTFSVKGTRPDTQAKLIAVIVSACQKKRLRTDGPTDGWIHPHKESQLIGKKAKQMESLTGLTFKPLKLMYICDLFLICHVTKLARI